MCKMRGRYKRRNLKGGSQETTAVGAGLSPLPGETAAGLEEPDTPVTGVTHQDICNKTRRSVYENKKVYLGVRVKMPVKDLLKNIRITQGWEPQNLKKRCCRAKGLKRAKTCPREHAIKVQDPTKSLEELAIIVEVLEEDLRTGNTYSSPSQNMSSLDPSVSPELSLTGYYSDEYDDMSPRSQSYMTYSPGYSPEYQQALSPPDTHSWQKSFDADKERFDPQNHTWNRDSSAFFWTQLQKEESQLRNISDDTLLASDEHGRTALHKVAFVGKRALGYAIAKRMAALNNLDIKDADGMTALLYAAKHNHHLMVADLIYLGANINEKNNSGKSCLHLSAENGYVRVLEVLKWAMVDDVYVDVEAADNSGMSALQCASVALKATVRELENSQSPSHTRLHILRQEQMLETLECLLQMGSYPHTMGSWSVLPRFA